MLRKQPHKRIAKEKSKFEVTRKRILSRKNISLSEKKQIIASERDLFKQRVANIKLTLEEEKHALLHPSPYKGFLFTKTLTGIKKDVDGKQQFFKFHDTYQRIYKAQKGFDPENLDTVVPKVFNDKRVQGILLVFEIYDKTDDITMMVSNYVTRELLDIIEENEETVFEYVVSRFQAYGDYVLKFIFMRVIYYKGKK